MTVSDYGDVLTDVGALTQAPHPDNNPANPNVVAPGQLSPPTTTTPNPRPEWLDVRALHPLCASGHWGICAAWGMLSALPSRGVVNDVKGL
jgi:hypothetical protein